MYLRKKWDDIEVYYPRYLVFPRNFLFASSGKRMYFGVSKLIEKIYQEFSFDIIHAHVALPDGFAAMLLKRRYTKPLVVTIHGQDLHVTLYRSTRCKKALTKVFEQADRVVTVSNKLKEIARDSLEGRR